ncbi:MAG: hypothetical protein D6785_11565 [Planctomycetota bacterium]|nr:MAG: hypothetical protein D6785_11565 [Planctomycetota bacterium]
MPPHHMGLWNKKALRYLENIFPIKLKGIFFEPLNEIRTKSFFHYTTEYYANKLRIPRQVVFKFLKLTHPYLASELKGFTVQAVFQKH